MTSDFPESATCDPFAAQYYLTLRYNPLLSPTLPRMTPSDMRPLNLTHAPEILCDMIVTSMHDTFDKLPADAKVAVALSGGVDSTLVLVLLRKYFPNLRIIAMTVRFEDAHDETQQASDTARLLGVDHVVVDAGDHLRSLPAAIRAVSQPMWDLHWYHIVKEASAQSATVLVSGDGGDELFGGYTFRYKKFLESTAIRGADTLTPKQKARAYLDCHVRDHVDDQDKVFGARMNFSWSKIYDVLCPHFDNTLDPLEQVFLADYNGKLLYNFSQVARLLSSHFGIATLAPLLSPRIIRHAMRVGKEQKYDAASNVGKLPLRSVIRMLGAERMVSDGKAGFSPNTSSYWQRHGYDACSAYLDCESARTICDGWINRDWISSHLHRDITDIRYINKFLGLLAFEVWYRMFVTKEMTHSATLY